MQTEEETLIKKKEFSPSLADGIWMLVSYTLLCPIIPLMILSAIFRAVGFSFEGPLAYIFSTLSSFSILILWLKRSYVINIKNMFSLEKVSVLFLLPMTIIILGAGILLSELGNLIQIILPISESWLKAFDILSGEGFAVWKAILSTAIIAPIIEEILFRGILLRGFLKHYSVRKSIILSALLFGLAHMNPWQFVSAFAAGIILGWWYVKTNSITTTIFGHALNNGMMFIFTAFGIVIPGYNTPKNILDHQPIWFDLLGVFLLSLGIVWLIKLFNAKQTILIETKINIDRSNL